MLTDSAIRKLETIAEKDPERLLSNQEARDEIGLTAGQFQRLRARPGFPNPVYYGIRVAHSPALLAKFLTGHLARLRGVSLYRLARELRVAPLTLKRWSALRGFPPELGERFNAPVYDRPAVREWVKHHRQNGMRLPDDWSKRRRRQ